MDVIIALAKTLMDLMVAHLWLDEAPISEPNFDGDFEALDAAAQAAHRTGRFHDMIALAEQAYEAASNDESGRCNRRCGGWDGMGRATDALEAIQDGLDFGGFTGTSTHDAVEFGQCVLQPLAGVGAFHRGRSA